MTRDEIIKLAREAGYPDYVMGLASKEAWEKTERFAALVAAAEREACIDINAMHGGSVEVEAAIRAKGEK